MCVLCLSELCAETGEQPLTDENDVYGLIFCPELQPAVPPWSFVFVLFTALLLFAFANCTVLYFANLLLPSYFCSIVPIVQIDLQVLPMCTACQVRTSGLMIAAEHQTGAGAALAADPVTVAAPGQDHGFHLRAHLHCHQA